jgi:hypothetical protein
MRGFGDMSRRGWRRSILKFGGRRCEVRVHTSLADRWRDASTRYVIFSTTTNDFCHDLVTTLVPQSHPSNLFVRLITIINRFARLTVLATHETTSRPSRRFVTRALPYTPSRHDAVSAVRTSSTFTDADCDPRESHRDLANIPRLPLFPTFRRSAGLPVEKTFQEQA